MGELIPFRRRDPDPPPRMFCSSCGEDVTTPSSAAVCPCPKCGSTGRQSWPPPADARVGVAAGMAITYSCSWGAGAGSASPGPPVVR